MNNCSFCKKDCTNPGGLGAHTPYCHLNPQRKKRPWSGGCAKKGSIPWNIGTKGLTGGWNKGIKGSTTGKAGSPEKEILRKQRISASMKKNDKCGGKRHASGRGKKGWYKGFFCDSSYELAYVIFCLEHNKKIERCTQSLPYFWEGTPRNYLPDFIVDGKIVEIKGYKSPQWNAKQNAYPNISVLYQKDLKDVFEYVQNKYGKDYIRLYETTVSSNLTLSVAV